MDDARSAPQGAHYHADVIYLLPYLGIKKRSKALWYSELSLHQLGSRPTAFIPRWLTHPCILYQVCATHGVTQLVFEHMPIFVGGLFVQDEIRGAAQSTQQGNYCGAGEIKSLHQLGIRSL